MRIEAAFPVTFLLVPVNAQAGGFWLSFRSGGGGSDWGDGARVDCWLGVEQPTAEAATSNSAMRLNSFIAPSESPTMT